MVVGTTDAEIRACREDRWRRASVSAVAVEPSLGLSDLLSLLDGKPLPNAPLRSQPPMGGPRRSAAAGLSRRKAFNRHKWLLDPSIATMRSHPAEIPKRETARNGSGLRLVHGKDRLHSGCPPQCNGGHTEIRDMLEKGRRAAPQASTMRPGLLLQRGVGSLTGNANLSRCCDRKQQP